MAMLKKIIKKPLLVVLSLAAMLLPTTLYAVTCPAGYTEDLLDWSALWNPAWNATLGPHTMTTADGVDVTVDFTVSGAGCTDANVTGSGSPQISATLGLQLFVDWPNNGCVLSTDISFSVGSPIDVQEVEFTVADIDSGSWYDRIIFNLVSTTTSGIWTVTTPPDQVDSDGLGGCGATNTNCHSTANWDGPLSGVSVEYTNNPLAPANPAGQVVWFSDIEFCYPDTVPVTLGAFKSNQLGNRITAEWQTVSESFNMGFTVWGEIDGEWQALSDKMIRSKSTDTAKVSRYRTRLNTGKYDQAITQLGLSSIDTNGTEEFYGPFEVGNKYGLESLPAAIEWQPIRSAYERKLAAADYEAVGSSRWRKRSPVNSGDVAMVSMSIPEAGIYRITYEDLLERGLDLSGVPVDEIAVSFKGQPVPRDVVDKSKTVRRNKPFGPGHSVIFYGMAPQGSDALYVDSLVYQVSRDASLAIKAGKVHHRVDKNADLATKGRKTYHIERDVFYDELVSSDDPWVMDDLFSFGAPVSKTYQFNLPHEPLGDEVSLEIQLNSITDFDQIDIDGDGVKDDEHHIRVFINNTDAGSMVIDETNDGTVSWLLKTTFSDALLRQGSNDIIIESPGDSGYRFSLVYIDDIDITVSENIEQSGASVQFSGVPEQGGFQVNSDLNGKLLAYAFTEQGNLARVRVRSRKHGQLPEGQRLLQISGISEPGIVASYWVSTVGGFLAPDGMWVHTPDRDLFSEPADYIVVTDPALVGEDLQRFVQYREENGLDVSVFTTDQIIDNYGYGMKTPEAIARFLREAHDVLAYKHVLLVGGHTYDYLNRLDAEVAPINMIPTFYRRTYGLINYSPTDLPFVDFDNSGTPDAAIGRWPLRTVDELKTIVDKTLAYDAAGGMADAQTALLIAERKGSGLEDFSSQLDRVEPFVGFTTESGEVLPWTQLSKIYVDQIEEEGFTAGHQANAEALRRIKEQIDQGQSLTVFSGHGSPTRWSNQNLFTANNISELTNFDKPTQIATLACYTTYYQSPSTSSLAHQFLFDPAGAVSVNGASVLGSIRGNEALLKIALQNMLQSEITMGEAIMRAKQQLFAQGKYFDTIITWITLGDPALSIRQ